MKKTGFFLLLMLIAAGSRAQYNLENKFTMPLKAVFTAMEEKYGVKLVYTEDQVADKELIYGLYQFKPDFERTLDIVLSKFDLDYTINPDGSYKIKPFEYARRRPEEGIERLQVLREEYSTLPEWEARKAELKECLYQTLGVAGLREHLVMEMSFGPIRKMNGYTVRNFALETLPGVYATGSLYQPARTKKGEKLPFILNPNGHFGTGRYAKEVQQRCAMFARMGAIAVNMDLFGYGESLLAFESADHKNSVALTMHTLQNLALLDYFYQAPNVDTERIAVTGGSGGGSQSMILTALDDRVSVSVPVIMVSSYFMGGCGCESGLPIGWCGRGTNLAEIAAMAAPRPMLIVSDGKDWTMLVEEYEYPFIKRTYGFYGVEDRVENAHFPTEGHNWSPAKRDAVYEFMARQLGLNAAAGQDKSGHWDESTLTIEEESAMKFFGPHGERFPADAVSGLDNLYRLIDRLTRP
ncbi:MAG: alpha/beta hydrolase [Rikenellaceae bacterium]|nr:alpha/beta hydrolase [Rikenellaceae bacterium]